MCEVTLASWRTSGGLPCRCRVKDRCIALIVTWWQFPDQWLPDRRFVRRRCLQVWWPVSARIEEKALGLCPTALHAAVRCREIDDIRSPVIRIGAEVRGQ